MTLFAIVNIDPGIAIIASKQPPGQAVFDRNGVESVVLLSRDDTRYEKLVESLDS